MHKIHSITLTSFNAKFVNWDRVLKKLNYFARCHPMPFTIHNIMHLRRRKSKQHAFYLSTSTSHFSVNNLDERKAEKLSTADSGEDLFGPSEQSLSFPQQSHNSSPF